MSRSAPDTNVKNPAVRYFEWKGKTGNFSWYDKEKEVNVAMKLPFTFIVLDRTSSVRGYSKKLKTGFYSNEIRDSRAEPLLVKSFSDNKIVTQGLWNDIRDTVIARGGKFTLCVYIAFKDKDTLKIGCIQMSASSMGPWFEFEKAHRKAIYEKAIQVKSSKKTINGDNEYLEPVYSLLDISPETNAAALELDKELQAYFASYFKRRADEKTPDTSAQPDAPQEEDHLPEPPEEEMPPVDENDPF